METWTLTWTKLTPLNATEIEKISTDTSGVYRLSYKHEDGNYYVFYIGKSTDIRKRLLEHIADSEPNLGIKKFYSSYECFFRYAIVKDEYVRNGAEKQLFLHYHPSCNDVEPSGRDDINVNFN
ncbi:MAG: GIY-YIG nuclease family protein [Bacteroidota bacterium]